MQLGGNFNNGANCGAFYVNVNNRLGNARQNNGALGMLNIYYQWTCATMPLGKNHKEEAASRFNLENCGLNNTNYD